MKILLANLPWRANGRQGVRAGSRWPHLKIPEEENYLPYPFFLGYATSLLKKNKFNARAIDAIAEELTNKEFLQAVESFKPDLLFAEISTPTLNLDLGLLKEIKETHGTKIAIAGPDMDIFNKEFMDENKHIDFAILGEYETTLLELAKGLDAKKDPKNILGLVINSKKNVIINEKRPLSPSLEIYPWPDREDFPIFKYHDCPGGIPAPSAQMISSRGCPYLCTFCVWPQLVYNGRNYRTRDVKDVVDEMEHLVKKGFKSIYFDDDTFNIGKKRMLELAKELKSRGWKTPWAFMGRSDLVDEEILTRFRDVGLKAVKYGVESGVQELVDNAEKNLNLKVATRNMILTRKLGIKMHLTFTLGLPGETWDTVKRSVGYAMFIDPDSVQFSIMTPFPGTRFHKAMKDSDMIISSNYADYDGNTSSVIKTSSMSNEELTKAQHYAYSRWHDFKFKKHKYANSPVKLFRDCLRENGIIYTIRHTFRYIQKKNYRWYKR